MNIHYLNWIYCLVVNIISNVDLIGLLVENLGYYFSQGP
jgi:hypothetical protein